MFLMVRLAGALLVPVARPFLLVVLECVRDLHRPHRETWHPSFWLSLLGRPAGQTVSR